MGLLRGFTGEPSTDVSVSEARMGDGIRMPPCSRPLLLKRPLLTITWLPALAVGSVWREPPIAGEGSAEAPPGLVSASSTPFASPPTLRTCELLPTAASLSPRSRHPCRFAMLRVRGAF